MISSDNVSIHHVALSVARLFYLETEFYVIHHSVRHFCSFSKPIPYRIAIETPLKLCVRLVLRDLQELPLNFIMRNCGGVYHSMLNLILRLSKFLLSH